MSCSRPGTVLIENQNPRIGDGRPAKDRASFGCCISSNRMHTHEWQKHIWRMTWEWLGTKADYIGVSGENGRAVIVEEGRVQRISGYERNWERGAGGLEKMTSPTPRMLRYYNVLDVRGSLPYLIPNYVRQQPISRKIASSCSFPSFRS